MNLSRSIRSATVVAALVVLAVFTASASAAVIHRGNQHFVGITLRRGVNLAAVKGSVAAAQAQNVAPAAGGLDYHGGPVLHSSAPYLIFWLPNGETLPAGSESLMARYFADVAADSGLSSDVFGVARQYYSATGIADYAQTFSPGQVIVDTTPYPSRDATHCPDVNSTYYPKCLTDAQLQTEIANLITARGLPGANSSPTPIYFIVTPSDVNVCYDASDCADNVFCGYHSFLGDGVLYAAIPFFLSADPSDASQYAKACQRDGTSQLQEPNANLADVAISYLSHEDNETVTDPVGTGWWDDTSGNEDGDNCAGVSVNAQSFQPTLGGDTAAGTLYDQRINGDPYYTQGEWSQGDGGCEMRPSDAAIQPGFAALNAGFAAVGSSQVFDPSASASTNGVSSARWSFGDGTPSTFQSGSGALGAVSHAYDAAGRYTVTLSLVDGSGNVATTTRAVTIGSPPVSSFGFSPAQPLLGTPVSFTAAGSFDGDSGVTITSYAWDFGDGSTGTGVLSDHTYASPGIYTVSLTVTNSLGLAQTTSTQVPVLPAPFVQPPRQVTSRPTALPSPISKVTVHKHRIAASIRITVSGPGTLSVGRKAVKVTKAGIHTVTVRLTNSQLLTLARVHRLTLRIQIRFAPNAGPASSITVPIRFRR